MFCKKDVMMIFYIISTKRKVTTKRSRDVTMWRLYSNL